MLPRNRSVKLQQLHPKLQTCVLFHTLHRINSAENVGFKILLLLILVLFIKTQGGIIKLEKRLVLV